MRDTLRNTMRDTLRNKSEAVFGPLNFFIFGYVKGGVMGNNNIGIKMCKTKFLWVLNFGQVGELSQQFSKSPYYGDFFQKWCLTCQFCGSNLGKFWG